MLFALGVPANDEERNHDKVVWLLDPVRLNKAFKFYTFLKPGYIPNVTEPAFNALFGPNAKTDKVEPAAAIGPLNNPRIIKQAGTFTVFPKTATIVPLDELPDSYKYLYEIVIKKEAREQMNNQLRHYGLTEHDMFPSIKTLPRTLRRS